MREYQAHTLIKLRATEQSARITVIVACYNIEKYIERCVRSIMNQTYSNLEILITDDGSTDSSGSICDRLSAEDDRIKVFHTENHGLGPARNYAIDRASGEFIAFVDGDDYIKPRMYEEMMSAMNEFNADIVVAGYEDTKESDTPSALGNEIDTVSHASTDEMKMVSHTSPNEMNMESHTSYEGQNREISGDDEPDCGYITDLAVMDSGELLTALVEENEKYVVQNCAWNKLYRQSTLGEQRYPSQLYEDIVYTTKLLTKTSKGVVLCDKLYYYVTDRSGSIMNQGVKWEIITQQIPSYRERDEVLIRFGRQDLADTHDYMVYKKLLLLYTQARRSADPERRAKMKELANVIRKSRERFDEIYSCPIANPHQALRTRLFLISPVLYNIFMDINDTFILPVKEKRAMSKEARS